MKPICHKCHMFFRPEKNGVNFFEGMPGPLGEIRKVISDGDEPLRMETGPLSNWTNYKLWVGDLYRCAGCGAEIIVGVPREPISEHYMPNFQELASRLGATIRIDDC